MSSCKHLIGNAPTNWHCGNVLLAASFAESSAMGIDNLSASIASASTARSGETQGTEDGACIMFHILKASESLYIAHYLSLTK